MQAASSKATSLPQTDDLTHYALVGAGTIGVFSLLSVAAALFSRDLLTADGYTHYLYARFAFSQPMGLVDVWGRPLCTLIYALPAALGGRVGVCLASLLMAIGCALVAIRIARLDHERMPVLALLFTLAQPLLFLHTLTAMTELPFALLLGLGYLAYRTQRPILMALLIGLTPLARPEGFGFLLLAGAALVIQRDRRALLAVLLLLPLLAWDIAGQRVSHSNGPWWRWLYDNWPYSSKSAYGRGNILTFVAQLPMVVSPLLLPATLIGIALSWTRWRRIPSASHATMDPPSVEDRSSVDPRKLASTPDPVDPDLGARLQIRVHRTRRAKEKTIPTHGLGPLLTALIPCFVLIVHSLLYATGRLGSYGEARYLLVGAPFWGVLSARGFTWLVDTLNLRRPLLWASAAVCFPIIANCVHPVVPLRQTPDWAQATRFATWFISQPDLGGQKLLVSHPGIWYAMDISPMDGSRFIAWDRQAVLHPRPGIVLAWDPIYSPRNSSAARLVGLTELEAAGWTADAKADAQVNGANTPATAAWHVYRSPVSAIVSASGLSDSERRH